MNEQGYTFLEALIALGVGALLFTGALGIVFLSNTISAEGLFRQEALWRAQEGLEALQTIAFEDLQLTETGSLVFAASQWTLGTDGPEELNDNLDRVIQVQAVERDENCGVVGEGGEEDVDSYLLTSEVSWNDTKGNTQTITLDMLTTNWEEPIGSCFGNACEDLSIDVTGADLYGGKQLRDIFIENTGTQDIVIDQLSFTWNDPSALISQVFIDNSKFWSENGPGTPSGPQSSGTMLDGEDEDILVGETVEMHKVQTEDPVEGFTVSFTLQCSDGSTIDSGEFTP
jgi:hypothetical protein